MQPEKEDIAFWANYVQGVKATPFNLAIPSHQLPPLIIHEHSFFAAKQDFSTYSKALEDNGCDGIDKNTLRKFKREEFAVEAVLDLHGKTENAAFAAVDDFVPRCYAQGKRCIVIVTGKGLNVENDESIFAAKGVLKKMVPQWLNLPRLRAMILIYKHPSARLGGEGALYILLRRRKK